MAENQVGLRHMYPLDDSMLGQIKLHYKNYLNWFHARNLQNPHEVNSNYYIERQDFPENCIFQISCLDVVSDHFPTILNNILDQSQSLTSFDTDRIKSVHQEYVKSQKNLQWFDSLQTWEQQGYIDEYLLSHSAIQGMIISRILKDCLFEVIDQLDYMAWQAFYYRVKDSSWPTCDDERDFCLLPKKIQAELIKLFNYVPKYNTDPMRAKCRSALANWKNLSLEEINIHYQSFKKNFKTLSSVS